MAKIIPMQQRRGRDAGLAGSSGQGRRAVPSGRMRKKARPDSHRAGCAEKCIPDEASQGGAKSRPADSAPAGAQGC